MQTGVRTCLTGDQVIGIYDNVVLTPCPGPDYYCLYETFRYLDENGASRKFNNELIKNILNNFILINVTMKDVGATGKSNTITFYYQKHSFLTILFQNEIFRKKLTNTNP